MIKQWPVIIQGALGSAVFWVFLLLAQKLIAAASLYYSKRSKEQRLSWLVSRECKHEAFGGADDARAAYSTSCLIYRSLRHCYKGFLWLGLGLITYPFIELGLVIGGVGMVYFFSKAFEVVAPFKEGENTTENWSNVRNEILELEFDGATETNKQRQSDA